MSKKLTELLKSLGVQNIDETLSALMNDEIDNNEIITEILKNAQTYAKPFLETEFNERLNNERSTLKGKYFKDALIKANKTFGNKLTNKEIEDILSNPENAGKTIDVALEVLKEKVSEKTGTSENELQKMLDLANSKLNEYEVKISTLETDYNKKTEDAINKFKLDGVIDNQLLKILDGKTSIPTASAIKLIKGQLTNKAVLKLKEDGNIGLYDMINQDLPLKKNETSLYNFEDYVTDTLDEYGLKKQSNGTQPLGTPTPPTTQQQNEFKGSSDGLASLMAKAVVNS